MVHPYIINTGNALLLIVLGLAAYFMHEARPPVLLVIPFIGALLLACTHHLRRHNRFVQHTVTSLTLLTGLLLVWMIDPETFRWDAHYVLLLLMGLCCAVAVAFYVSSFIRERRTRNNSIYKDDL